MVTALGIKNYCPRRKCKNIFAGFLRICYSINNTKKIRTYFKMKSNELAIALYDLEYVVAML